MVVKWRNKVCLDLKTTMMLLKGFLLNHEKVELKLIMKPYWLLGIGNDEAIAKRWRFENLKEANLHFMMQCVFLEKFQ